MTTQQDASITFKKETTYGTSVTPDVAVEFLEEDLEYLPEYVQGAGMRVGKIVARGDRRVLGKEMVGGSFTVEGVTKGLGKLFEAALGTASSTLIAGTSYQQLFTATTTDYLPSYTIQKGIPFLGGATTTAHTFTGMVCSGFELSAAQGGIPTIKFNWVGKALATGTAYAAPSYPTGVAEFSFIHGSLRVGGSVTVPTTTALAVGGTASAIVTDIDLAWDNALDEGGFTFGGAGQRVRKPAVGLRSLSGSLTAEYTDSTLRDAFIAQTDVAIVLTFATTTLISGSSFPTLQVVIPLTRLDGELPKASGGEVVSQTIPFTGLDNGVAASPIYVAIVTAETAI